MMMMCELLRKICWHAFVFGGTGNLGVLRKGNGICGFGDGI